MIVLQDWGSLHGFPEGMLPSTGDLNMALGEKRTFSDIGPDYQQCMMARRWRAGQLRLAMLDADQRTYEMALVDEFYRELP